MRQPLVIGNWKMHSSMRTMTDLLGNIIAGADDVHVAQIAVCPPYTYLYAASTCLSDTSIAVGAQNMHYEAKGSFTGEISPYMLVDCGCTFVLLGHSERRHVFGETDEIIAAKFSAAKSSGLTPIICVGETLEQREAGKTMDVVRGQLEIVLELGAPKFEQILGLEKRGKALYNAVVAYEPVWAIGTGKTASPEQAQEVHAGLRAFVAEYDEALAQQTRILYGGSVRPTNAADLFSMPDIDGALIGGASLDSEHFLDIAKSCNNLF